MSSDKPQGFQTRAVHAGTPPDSATGARQMPIYQTTSYVFDSPEHARSLFGLEQVGYIYSRLTNPTVGALEERLAALEGGVGATVTSSGHAAQILALFPLMYPGDEIVAATKLYGGSINQFSQSFKRFGWNVKFVDMDQPESIAAAGSARTKAVFCENLANPGGIVTDLEKIASQAHQLGVPLIVDSTLATPVLNRPFEHGADIVVHSTTKFLSGNGTAIGGAVIDSGTFDWAQNDKFPSLTEPEPSYHGIRFYETFGQLAYTLHGHAMGLRDLGGCQSPQNAFLTLLGTETVALRVERHCRNAERIAQWLETRSGVNWVSYAGLDSSPYRGLAKKYFPHGTGAVLTFGLEGGYEAGVKTVENAQLFSHLANIGDTRSLIIHPASTTHSQLTPEDRAKAGAGDDVVRLSVGLEDVDDLLADLDNALTQATGKRS